MSDGFSEHEFLAWLREHCVSSELPVPIGDDAAMLATGPNTLVAVDAVVEGVHLQPGADLAERMARKALRVNLSDIAAMGGRAKTAFLALGVSTGVDASWPRRFVEALVTDCERYGVLLAGGDTVSAGERAFASVTVTGEPIAEPVLRKGAQLGDLVLVTGELGGSILGKHENFEPRLDLAEELMHLGPPSAMADVSDGLLRDLANIAHASGCGAVIEVEKLPIAEAARELSARDGKSPAEHALHDGEDFELVFTMSPDLARKCLEAWKMPVPLTVIGEMVAEGLWLEEDGARRASAPGGFDHGPES